MPLRAAAEPVTEALRYDRLLVTVICENPYLSEGSRQAIATGAALARQHSGSSLTCLVVDRAGGAQAQAQAQERDSVKVKLQTVGKAFADAGVGAERLTLLEKAASGDSCGSALIGDVADELDATLVLVSSEAIHNKQVDMNLMAEFAPCPVLLLPL